MAQALNTSLLNTTDPIIADQLARYDEDRGRSDLWVCLVCILSVVLAFPLRIYAQALPLDMSSKKFRKNWSKALWRSDTYFLFFASLFGIATAIANIVPLQYGFGKHQARVLLDDPFAPRNIIKIAISGYIMKIVQFPSIMFTKLAIISVYHRVFSVNRTLTYTLYAIGVYTIALGIGCTLLFIFVCHPVRVFWERLYFILPGTIPPGATDKGFCVPVMPTILTPLFLEFVSEVALLLFPAIALRKARLSLRKKVGLYFVFTLGGFVTAMSAIRLHYIVIVKDLGDLTWEPAPAVVWTSVQTCFGVVCASLPGTAPLLRLWRERDRAEEIMAKKMSKGSVSSTASSI